MASPFTAIYRKGHRDVVSGKKTLEEIADVLPQIAIEVGINADVADTSETGYIYKKTRKLLDFGVEKVFWVLTDAQAVIVATKERMETINWMRNIKFTHW